MIFYGYDEKTKEYIGTQNAFIDPLETKKQGKDVYLVPANSTDIKPTLEPSNDNEMLVFNGEGWELKSRFELNGIYNTTDNHIYEFCEKNGYHLEQVENGFKICAPAQKSDDEVALEELEQQEATLNAQIAQLKDQLLTATLADDTEQVEAIKAEYQNLVGVQDYDSN